MKLEILGALIEYRARTPSDCSAQKKTMQPEVNASAIPWVVVVKPSPSQRRPEELLF